MPMNCLPDYPGDSTLLKPIHGVGSYGGGGGGCYKLHEDLIKQISSIQDRRLSKSEVEQGQKGQDKVNKNGSPLSVFKFNHQAKNPQDVEKGSSVILQVQDSRVVKMMAYFSTLLLLLVLAVVLTIFFNARPSGFVRHIASDEEAGFIFVSNFTAFTKYKN